MEVRFHIDENTVQNMTWEEFETFERAQEGDLKLFQLRPVLARFMVNGGEKHLPHKKAMEILGQLPLSKVQETIEIFTTAIRDGVIPKENASLSSSPSEAKAAGSESPDGSGSSSSQEIGQDPPGKSPEKT